LNLVINVDFEPKPESYWSHIHRNVLFLYLVCVSHEIIQHKGLFGILLVL